MNGEYLDRYYETSSKVSNGRLRDEYLNVEWFGSLADARRTLALARKHYKHPWPHSALGDQTPVAFASRYQGWLYTCPKSRSGQSPIFTS